MLRPRRRAVAPLVLLFYPHSLKAEDHTSCLLTRMARHDKSTSFHQALIVGPPSPLGKRSVGASRLIDRHFTSADSQISDFRFRFSVFSHHFRFSPQQEYSTNINICSQDAR
ncbi:hypothetical protein NOF04DRAFT_2944 [Fusarium oxysporum II5]|uniref:Secreted protein n=2 Tax=Fusarium oxysporum species complex TaxID=171631 RepID=X0JJV7_FUSO5|nr:uncharacterized protein FOIG_07136 [Fusarium odoratissimum NRRL 54006]EXM01564.1 hypothetical protein FOIG_07136 [Fusarium odoratissimum NRRL 54006]KAK2129748.1 hypothetical protein NOF04DRAFT_2944 [Fusarium oxysporum II5]TXC01822.1 hypothetical protein FocTR4_00008628 [Fusarium oxysporum f. sp. cubense]